MEITVLSDVSIETREELLKEIHELLCNYRDLPSPPWIVDDPVQGAYERLRVYLLARSAVSKAVPGSYERHERLYRADSVFMAFVDNVIPRIWNDVLKLGSSPISDTDEPTIFVNSVRAALDYIKQHPDQYPLG